MDKHWNAFCALSLVHFLAFPECQGGDGLSLESVARLADDDFFSALEMTRVNNAAARPQVRSLIEQTHMLLDFGAQPLILGGKLNLNSTDSSERHHAVDTLKSYLPMAVELGARAFVILSGADPGEAGRPAATERLVESILALCEAARGQGLRVTLETFDRTVDKKALIGPAAEAAALAATIKADFPDFGLLYDMGHMPLLDETPRPALNTLKAHLVHAHVGNCVKVTGRPSYGDFHPRFGFPGGENDVPQLVDFLRALFEVGYLRENPPVGARPWVGFEMRPQTGETSAVTLANMKRTWHEAWWRV